jgi:hypothetical protein
MRSPSRGSTTVVKSTSANPTCTSSATSSTPPELPAPAEFIVGLSVCGSPQMAATMRLDPDCRGDSTLCGALADRPSPVAHETASTLIMSTRQRFPNRFPIALPPPARIACLSIGTGGPGVKRG